MKEMRARIDRWKGVIPEGEQLAADVSLDPTGRALEAAILDAARLYGWRVHHVRPGRTLRGWRTPVQGDPGFPDFVLARRIEGRIGRLIFIEAKAGRARLSRDQRAWHNVLFGLREVEWYQIGDHWLEDDGDGNALTRLLR